MKFDIKSIKDILKKDNKMKLLAFFFAVIIWIVVTLSLYPDTTITVKNIEVNINLSDTYVNEMGLNVIEGEGQTVTAKISGNRSEIGSLNARDFVAAVNLDGITTASEYDLDVVVNPVNSDIKCEIVDVSPSKIKVKFDNVVSKTLEIEPQTSAVIPDGYVMGTLDCSPKTIKITGPEQIIEKVNSCVAFAATGSMTETKAIQASVMLYDEQKNLIENKEISYSTDDVLVTVPVYEKKTVPFDLVYRNIPNGFDTSKMNYVLSNSEIEVAATSETIAKIDKISLSYIDFREIELGSTFNLEVTLPTGIQNISGIETVEVSFPTENYDSKIFAIGDIKILNAPAGYDISLLTSKLQRVTILGPKDIISKLTANDVIAEIDLSTVTITEGTQAVAVNVYVPNKGTVWAYGTYSATITVTKTKTS